MVGHWLHLALCDHAPWYRGVWRPAAQAIAVLGVDTSVDPHSGLGCFRITDIEIQVAVGEPAPVRAVGRPKKRSRVEGDPVLQEPEPAKAVQDQPTGSSARSRPNQWRVTAESLGEWVAARLRKLQRRLAQLRGATGSDGSARSGTASRATQAGQSRFASRIA
jgi:hypothetical protein